MKPANRWRYDLELSEFENGDPLSSDCSVYFNFTAYCRFVPIANYLQLHVVKTALGEDLVNFFWNIR